MTPTWRRILGQGLVAGLIGFATIAVVLAVVNLAAGRSPFFTAAVLGAALFYGISDPALVSVTPAYVFAYNGVHLAVFLVFGLVAAALAAVADRGWQLWYLALFFFIFIAFHLIAAVEALAAPMRATLPDAVVWGAGIAASVLMATYLIRAHPRMRTRQSW
jgi:hypothetical protein